MSDAQPAAPVPGTPAFDPDFVFPLLSDATRRRALVTIARSGPKTATDLAGSNGKRADTTLKHLVVLVKAGLLLTAPDPNDGRKTRYGLSPKVLVTKTAEGTVLDFGCCVVRF